MQGLTNFFSNLRFKILKIVRRFLLISCYFAKRTIIFQTIISSIHYDDITNTIFFYLLTRLFDVHHIQSYREIVRSNYERISKEGYVLLTSISLRRKSLEGLIVHTYLPFHCPHVYSLYDSEYKYEAYCSLDQKMHRDKREAHRLERRSSILKPMADETTKLQSNQSTVLGPRRVSFHNTRKVQQFDKENHELQNEIQEEPMQLTNTSDGIRSETALSTSVVAGAPRFQNGDRTPNETIPMSSMSMRSDHPQASSTPLRHSIISTNANTTLDVFRTVETGKKPPLEQLTTVIHIEDQTVVVTGDKGSLLIYLKTL